MPRNVVVYVEGLALCYKSAKAGGAWHVCFVCGPDHLLKLKEPKQLPNLQLRIPNVDLVGRFTGSTFVSGSPGNYPSQLLNLNGANAHDKKLKWERRHCRTTTKIILELPKEANISVDQTTPNYHVEEVRGSSGPISVGVVAKRLRFDFQILSGDMFVRVAQGETVAYSESFDDSGNPLTFEFNNHCDLCRSNDTLDLYDVIKEPKGGDERRFVTGTLEGNGHVRDYNAGPHCRRPSIWDKFWNILFAPPANPYGNCDPMGVDPPLPGDP
jgi:hypothetical protein